MTELQKESLYATFKLLPEAGFALLDTNLEESENGSIRMIYNI
jgi:hypothetical protein